MKKFLFAAALVLFGCASDVAVPTGFVVTDVSAAPPPAPPKDTPVLPGVKVEVHSGDAASVKVAARTGVCGGVRCKVRGAASKLRVFKR